MGAGPVRARAPRPGLLCAAALVHGGTAVPDCWVADLDFRKCCRVLLDDAAGVYTTGVAACWGGGYSYETCCLPELEARYSAASELVLNYVLARRASPEGPVPENVTNDLLEASESLQDVFMNYDYTAHVDETHFRKMQSRWEDIARMLHKEYAREGEGLAWPDFAHHFAGLRARLGPSATPAEAVLAFHEENHEEWWQMHSAWSSAQLGKLGGDDARMHCPHDAEWAEDAECDAADYVAALSPAKLRYFRTFSERPPFQPFTPSLLYVYPSPEYIGNMTQFAKDMDEGAASILIRQDEPKLGRAWAGCHLHSYNFWGDVAIVALLSRAVRRWTQGGGEPESRGGAAAAGQLHVLQIGGGYGSIPHLAVASGALPLPLRQWAVLDLPFATELQAWYLHETLGPRGANVSLVRGAPWGAGARLKDFGANPVVRLVSSGHREFFFHLMREGGVPAGPRVCIAAHSLNELGAEEFLRNLRFIAEDFRADVLIYQYAFNRGYKRSGAAKRKLILERGFQVLEEPREDLVVFGRSPSSAEAHRTS